MKVTQMNLHWSPSAYDVPKDHGMAIDYFINSALNLHSVIGH